VCHALVNGNQALGSALDLPDQNHRHSLAAAIKCGSDLPGFPRRSTTAPPLGGDARTSHSPYLVRLSLREALSNEAAQSAWGLMCLE
jgi:hypothetical protein